MFQMKYWKNEVNTSEFSNMISLTKFKNSIFIGTNDNQLFADFVLILKQFCILDNFSQEYEMLDLLGSGHFAHVYLVRHKAS